MSLEKKVKDISALAAYLHYAKSVAVQLAIAADGLNMVRKISLTGFVGDHNHANTALISGAGIAYSISLGRE